MNIEDWILYDKKDLRMIVTTEMKPKEKKYNLGSFKLLSPPFKGHYNIRKSFVYIFFEKNDTFRITKTKGEYYGN